MNKVLLQGNLGKNPELTTLPSGMTKCTFSMATTERRGKDKENITEWHYVIAWGKQAEVCAEYLCKGSSVLVDGRLRTRNYEDNSGVKRYVTEIHTNEVTFLDKKKEV
ncbi:MAG: single-stranded DNA-binding protein [Bacteroidetes bacterium]|nr:MAG: single-stranded DNA-binding protein [Bacteroidota bacterium]